MDPKDGKGKGKTKTYGKKGVKHFQTAFDKLSPKKPHNEGPARGLSQGLHRHAQPPSPEGEDDGDDDAPLEDEGPTPPTPRTAGAGRSTTVAAPRLSQRPLRSGSVALSSESTVISKNNSLVTKMELLYVEEVPQVGDERLLGTGETSEGGHATESLSKTEQGPSHRSGRDLRVRRQDVPEEPSWTFVKPLLELCAHKKHRESPAGFQEWSNLVHKNFEVEKIAEATFGEVYRLKMRGDRAENLAEESIFKVVAIKPDKSTKKPKRKDVPMSAVEDIMGEVTTLQRMSEIPGFAVFRDMRVLRGRPPSQFVEAWKKYLDGGNKTYFPDPGRKASYAEDQLWAVLEMQNAGTDLERIQLRSDLQVWDVFWGVAMALAKGEQDAKFEHRDLHVGNVCVRHKHGKPLGLDTPDSARFLVRPKTRFGLSKLKITIIDYGLSRFETDEQTGPDGVAVRAPKRVVFKDLEEDPDLFKGQGDDQYDIYRYMRLALDTREPPIPIQPEDVPNPEPSRDHDWSRYAPYTNVLWLWHLIVVLQRNRTPDALKEPALDDTAGQDITPRRRKRGEEVAAFVNGKLRQLEAMLDPTLRPLSPVFSASDLVVWALDNQWLEPEDVQEVDSPRLRYDARLRPPDERNNTYQFDENEKPLGLPRKGWNDE